MARTVNISTPVPSLEEFGKSLGLSKSRQNTLLKLVRRENENGEFSVRHRDTSAALKGKMTPVKK